MPGQPRAQKVYPTQGTGLGYRYGLNVPSPKDMLNLTYLIFPLIWK